jgi:hypothetical protein
LSTLSAHSQSLWSSYDSLTPSYWGGLSLWEVDIYEVDLYIGEYVYTLDYISIHYIDDRSSFPKHPYDQECRLYKNSEDITLGTQQQIYTKSCGVIVKNWFKSHQALLLLLLFLIFVWLVIAVSSV